MKQKIVVFVCTFLLLLITGCSKEDELAKELILEKNAVSLSEGETTSISITSGNGNYKVSSSDEAIVTATPSSNKIETIAKSYGTTTITVTDAKYKTAKVTVTVTSNALKDTELRFEWDGLKVLLDKKANEWAKTQRYTGADIGIVNLTQKKSLRTSGLKDHEKGVKSNIKLLLIENGGTEQSISLEKFEIIDVANGIFTAVGNNGTKRLIIRDKIPQ